MIYLNHAATTYPKPPTVLEAVHQTLASPPCETTRSTSCEKDIADICRNIVAPVLGVRKPSRIFFTSGATESYNLILRGLDPSGKTSLISTYEHNALLRPLWALTGGNDVCMITPGDDGLLSPDDIRAKAKDAAFVFVNHCSNVTGAVQNLSAIANAAHESGALLVADVSQSAGLMPLTLEDDAIDIAVFTGHKALFGLAGIGGFYLREGVSLPTAKWGGTGSGGREILSLDPEEFEVGTQNLCGLAGLAAGASFVLEIGLDEIACRIKSHIARKLSSLRAIEGVRIYGTPSGGASIAFNIDGLSPADTGYILRREYDIVTRTGFHCAPLLADVIGAPQGTVRASISYMTTDAEIDQLIQAVTELSAGVMGIS